jgi:hypothetical protein
LLVFSVQAVFAFRSPHPKQNISRGHVKSFFCTLEEGEPERLLASLRQHDALLRVFDIEQAPVEILRLPTQFARLLASGYWHSDGVYAFRDFHNLSSWSVGWHRRGRVDEFTAYNPHDPDDLMLLTDTLREAAAKLRPLAPTSDAISEALGGLHYITSVFQYHEDECNNFLYEATRCSTDMGRASVRAFNTTLLFNCVLG